MSYKNLKEKFEDMKIVVLDGGNGGELERLGDQWMENYV